MTPAFRARAARATPGRSRAGRTTAPRTRRGSNPERTPSHRSPTTSDAAPPIRSPSARPRRIPRAIRRRSPTGIRSSVPAAPAPTRRTSRRRARTPPRVDPTGGARSPRPLNAPNGRASASPRIERASGPRLLAHRRDRCCSRRRSRTSAAPPANRVVRQLVRERSAGRRDRQLQRSRARIVHRERRIAERIRAESNAEPANEKPERRAACHADPSAAHADSTAATPSAPCEQRHARQAELARQIGARRASHARKPRRALRRACEARRRSRAPPARCVAPRRIRPHRGRRAPR